MSTTVEIRTGVIQPAHVGNCVVAVKQPFRAVAAERVEGIDYNAFEIAVFVGSRRQSLNNSSAQALFEPCRSIPHRERI